MAYVPYIEDDHQFDPQYFDPVFRDVFCGAVPDLSRDWGVEYDTEGPSSATQSWIIPRTVQIPLAMRQMLSWNRDKYKLYYRLLDWNEPSSSGKYFDRPIVPVSARLTPLPTNNSPAYLANHFYTEFSSKIATGSESCGSCEFGVFPAIYTDKYRLDIQWARDEFTNRFGIKYAKVEIDPSIRLESITGSAQGLVKMDADGNPDVEDGGVAIEKLTTGFPSREAQVLVKVTFPWVSLKNPGNACIVKNGPIGNWIGAVLGPGEIPNGLLLGCINADVFLGYPRGHVLYQSAALVEKVSPVTGRLGYQVTHDFLCLANCQWNMSRLQGEVDANVLGINAAAGQQTALWPYGYIVATDKTGRVTFTAAQPPLVASPVFPYPYADLSRLMYYGGTNDNPPFDEA